MFRECCVLGKDEINEPSEVKPKEGGRIIITYQSSRLQKYKDVARQIPMRLVTEIYKAVKDQDVYLDIQDPNCGIDAIFNPNEKRRKLHITGQQKDGHSCGLHLANALRHLYTIKAKTGSFPKDETMVWPDELMTCWRRRVLKDIWPTINWETDLLKDKFYDD